MPTANCITGKDRSGQVSFDYEWAWEDSPEWEEVTQAVGDTHRWHTDVMIVIREVATGKLYGTIFRRGNTEYQENEWGDRDWYGDKRIWFHPVVAVERIITEYQYA